MLNIHKAEVEQLVCTMATEQGLALKEVILVALQDFRDRQLASQAARRARLDALCQKFSALPILDPRTPEEILGFDENGAFQ